MNYYNEHDPFAAAWLRKLIEAKMIGAGEVDERDIQDVRPDELRLFTQCHFFAGIGVWSYALQQAGWADDRPVWTGSCPCQPFSTAGKRKGTSDERHLWPAFHHLIRECRPVCVFGEQVASKDGLAWVESVQADLEAEKYAVGISDLCAAGFGAPHIRQRLYFVADAKHDGHHRQNGTETITSRDESNQRLFDGNSYAGVSELGNANNQGLPRHRKLPEGRQGAERHDPTAGFWGEADWVYCRDQKYRPIEPSTFPLAYGSPNRVGRLRGYGNALVAPVAQGFIEAYLGVIHDRTSFVS